MATSTRSVILLTAALAAAPVAEFATSGPRAKNSTATAQVAQRFPLKSEIPITYFVSQKFIAAQKIIATQKSLRRPNSAFCASTPNGWPYVSQECRVAAGTHVPTLMRS